MLSLREGISEDEVFNSADVVVGPTALFATGLDDGSESILAVNLADTSQRMLVVWHGDRVAYTTFPPSAEEDMRQLVKLNWKYCFATGLE